MVSKALNIAYKYLIAQDFRAKDLLQIFQEISKISYTDHLEIRLNTDLIPEKSYQKTQDLLSTLNEKESIRKSKGVYYTPQDVVQFITANAFKLQVDNLTSDNISSTKCNTVNLMFKTVFDPTCGAGEFLISALDMKFDMLDKNINHISSSDIKNIIKTIKGNDSNSDSIVITKLRILLSSIHRYGIKNSIGISDILNQNFTNYDFVETKPDTSIKYDIILGNPPYVEDSKCELNLFEKFGNIYASTLKNSAMHLNKNGVMGFVIPLSYVSTPRMKKIREDLFKILPQQYILSYSDRPDCLFTSVHQKLCILVAKNCDCPAKIYTSNYKYWYKEERSTLFSSTNIISNPFATTEYIPKLGNKCDLSIYKKISELKNSSPLIKISANGSGKLYLNMRAAFWIKAFVSEHSGSEYKKFIYQNQNIANYIFCILNSSLFWWYWISVSDCWHITNKELSGFKVPNIENFNITDSLATELESMLEQTKVYVGTKQTEYEYKHKSCIEVIHKIDDYINNLYELSAEESKYIKKFAYTYRTSGGIENAKKDN